MTGGTALTGTALTGTARLYRLGARVDRIQLPSWIAAGTLLTVVTASSFASLYPTEQDRLRFAASVTGNAALRALTGPPFNLTSIGGLTAWRIGSLIAVLAGLMSVFAVVRHTRAEEDSGRSELIGACAVGRPAPLAAALFLTLTADAMLGLLICLGLIANQLPVAGSAALGASAMLIGWFFAAVAAMAAQVCSTARGANSVSVSVLGFAYLLRAVGDSAGHGTSWLSWVSPIGWSQQVRPFAAERWWVLALLAIGATLLASAAFAINSNRDLAAGLIAPRLGPAQAGPALARPLGLAWRLHRASVVGWAAAFAVLGTIFGLLAQTAADLLNQNPALRDKFVRTGGTGSVVDAYLAAMFDLLGILAAAYAVQAILRLRGEEVAQRAELVLATRVSRWQLLASHLAFAVVGPALLLTIAGFCGGLVHGAQVHDVAGQLGSLTTAAVGRLPAVWLLVGITAVLIGMLPRQAPVSLALVGICFLISELGSALGLSHWMLDLSPFTHLPRLPGGSAPLTPTLALTLVALAALAIGAVGFQRRDIG